MQGRTLTVAQARLLAVIEHRMEQGEPPPSYRELCKEFHWTSTGTARDHLKALARKGYVELSGTKHRLIRLRSGRPPTAQIPVVGRVSAGVPVLAEENIQGYLPFPVAWKASGVHFAVRVSGHSMSGAGICDGDYVVLRQQHTADNGEIVIVAIDADTTLKRYERQDDGSVLLRPENPDYSSIPITSETSVIQGVLVGLVRFYGDGQAVHHLMNAQGLSSHSAGGT